MTTFRRFAHAALICLALLPTAAAGQDDLETHPGYFSQDHSELPDDGKQTLEAWLWDHCPGEVIGYVRGQLAQVLFKKDDVEKKIGNLSGGEAARLVFAKLAVTHPNVLVLDEPANGLDPAGNDRFGFGEQLRGERHLWGRSTGWVRWLAPLAIRSFFQVKSGLKILPGR